MEFSPPLQRATLIQRYKRFLADVITPDGRELTLHCPNTGAMTGCATPGDTVWYSTSDNTSYTPSLIKFTFSNGIVSTVLVSSSLPTSLKL